MEWLKEWAQVIGAGITLLAVLVALGIGVASILHTQSMQKRERKERLLNEIIEWAVDIIEFSTTGSVMSDKELELIISNLADIDRMYSAHKLEYKLQVIASKGSYIESIASLKFPSDLTLQACISNIRQKLRNHAKVLDLEIKGNIKNTSSIGKHAGRLIKSAKELLEYVVTMLPTI